jgi:hypothetical protein
VLVHLLVAPNIVLAGGMSRIGDFFSFGDIWLWNVQTRMASWIRGYQTTPTDSATARLKSMMGVVWVVCWNGSSPGIDVPAVFDSNWYGIVLQRILVHLSMLVWLLIIIIISISIPVGVVMHM